MKFRRSFMRYLRTLLNDCTLPYITVNYHMAVLQKSKLLVTYTAYCRKPIQGVKKPDANYCTTTGPTSHPPPQYSPQEMYTCEESWQLVSQSCHSPVVPRGPASDGQGETPCEPLKGLAAPQYNPKIWARRTHSPLQTPTHHLACREAEGVTSLSAFSTCRPVFSNPCRNVNNQHLLLTHITNAQKVFAHFRLCTFDKALTHFTLHP